MIRKMNKAMWNKVIVFMMFLSCLAGSMAAQGVIDVHCHNILPFYTETLEKHDAAMDEGFPLPA